MKIGILSMQRVKNYGSFLQGFALKKTMESFGCECEFIEIEQGHIFPKLARTPLFYFKKAIERYFKWDAFTILKYTRLFNKRFETEFFSILEINKHNISKFDVVVIGSDEVFNFAQHVPWGYTSQLFGDVKNADKVFSYAASFGHTTMKEIESFGVKDKISTALKNLSTISVRDCNSFEIVKALIDREPLLHVDPVIMFNYDKYIKPVDKAEYIVIYTYPNRIKSKEEVMAIRSFAKKHNKKLISIGFYFSWCDETVVPDPFEVLGYIKGADYIITDTFHGAVMSVKFNKKFVALVRKSNIEKMTSLLVQFNLTNRIIENLSTLEAVLTVSIDYSIINNMIQNEQKKSIDYLQTIFE